MKRIGLLIFIAIHILLLFNVSPVTAAKTISINFEQVPLGSVLQVLTNKTGRKFITDTKLSAKKIVLHLKGVTPDEAVNALLDTYDLYYVRQKDTNIYVVKSKTEGRITTGSQIFYCSYAKARDLIAVLESKLTAGGYMNADDRTNALIVSDTADNIERISSLIDELDSPTPQVLLEARIIDIKISKTFDSGLNLSVTHDTNDDGIEVSKYTQPYNPSQSISGRITTNIINGDYDIDAIIESLITKTEGKVLTNPKLLVLNNQKATINIVDEIPYQQLTETGEGGKLTSTSFKTVGVKLAVKPLVNKDGTIILRITPEQSFTTGVSATNVPIINTSKVDTTLMLRDGETVVIGGLIRETDSDSEFKIPILGDIPILGYLFKKKDMEKARTELTIFVTAHIIEEYY